MDPVQRLVRRVLDTDADRRALARAALAGGETRLRRGVYADSAGWRELEEDQRTVQRIHALALVSDAPPVFSHWSAAALLGLPSGVRPEARLHRSVDEGSAPNQPGVLTHLMPVPFEDRVQIGGLWCTSVARTAVDVAAACSLEDGVIVADAALRLLGGTDLGRTALRAAWDRAQPRRANRKVERVIAFADALAQSPNESLSRVSMHRLRLPTPVLQQRFTDRRGFVADVDFWLPEHRVIGEADGAQKYLDPAMNRGDAARVVYEEKRREDRLRALGHHVVRWGWREAVQPPLLLSVFAAAGVHPVR